jgi:regulator of RNase E activity RraA
MVQAVYFCHPETWDSVYGADGDIVFGDPDGVCIVPAEASEEAFDTYGIM